MGKAMVPASVIADMICQEIGDNTGAKKLLLLQYIALGYQQMNIFMNMDKTIRTSVFEIDGFTQFDLECGFIRATKVGVRQKRGADKPAGKICNLTLNTDMDRSTVIMNDTQTMNDISSCICDDVIDTCDYYYYNSPCGTMKSYGRGYHNNGYYNIQDGVINISPYLNKLGSELELVVEGVYDVLSIGMTLVPSEAYLCLYYFAKARYNQEGEYGTFQTMYESNFKTLNRLYNFKSIDQIVESLRD